MLCKYQRLPFKFKGYLVKTVFNIQSMPSHAVPKVRTRDWLGFFTAKHTQTREINSNQIFIGFDRQDKVYKNNGNPVKCPCNYSPSTGDNCAFKRQEPAVDVNINRYCKPSDRLTALV